MGEKQGHTPGPWGDVNKTVLVRGLTSIAHANYETEIGEANARLILSAPEMLEALQAWIYYDESDERDGTGMMIAYDVALQKTLIAIAAATGASDAQ